MLLLLHAIIPCFVVWMLPRNVSTLSGTSSLQHFKRRILFLCFLLGKPLGAGGRRKNVSYLASTGHLICILHQILA